GETWLGWTETRDDPKDRDLGAQRLEMVDRLRRGAERIRAAAPMFGAARREMIARADEIDGLLDFFGAAGQRSTRAALDFARRKGRKVRYCQPSDPPRAIDGVDARLYVLGPPENPALLKRHAPSKRTPETYGMSAFAEFLGAADWTMGTEGTVHPFAAPFVIPWAAAESVSFFQKRYWATACDDGDGRQDWRRIDASWLDMPADLALKLDAATNNTSLVLALELPPRVVDGESVRDVLLFAADAQVGNWLSWQDLEWTAGERMVTGPDLLARTILYKVGHHGSHNATLREKGLEQMTRLQYAMIPVDATFARETKGWDAMPLTDIVDRLGEITGGNRGAVLRADMPAPRDARVRSTDLFHELTL
ncbi:MAG: hypothetical protein AB7O45_14205, partial [Alphaproteobacteria bacterium]